MRYLRVARRLALLVSLVLACTLPHLLARRAGNSPWPRRFLGAAARACGFDVRIRGTPLLHDVFFAANHLSWIDILALGGATGCAFISKDDIQRAPVVGWLAAQNGTIFIARERRGVISGQIESVRSAISAHQPIALFPEGTTGDGTHLLPFKPALFAVLLPPPRAILIQPVLIDYGDATDVVVWRDGESGVANALRILGARRRRAVTLHFLPPFDPSGHADRKALSAEIRARMEAALAATNHLSSLA